MKRDHEASVIYFRGALRWPFTVFLLGVVMISVSTILQADPMQFSDYGLSDLEISAPKENRPHHLVAIVAEPDGTETTDFIIPYGVLKESGVVDVVAVSTRPGPVSLHPALTIRADKTFEVFDETHPAGADIVIVPAIHNPENPLVIDWIRQQHEKGATVVSICDGVWVLGYAGLLENRSVTGHWYSMNKLQREYPAAEWVKDRRYVADGKVMSTTGVSASIPASIALVYAIAGSKIASSLADRLGVDSFDPHHETGVFELTVSAAWTVVKNRILGLNRETIGIPIADGIDEIALSLSADAWARTYRSRVRTISGSFEDGLYFQTRRGLWVKVDADLAAADYSITLSGHLPGQVIDASLSAISDRYGFATADIVALQLEYNRWAQNEETSKRIEEIEQQVYTVVKVLKERIRGLLARVHQLERELETKHATETSGELNQMLSPGSSVLRLSASSRVVDGETAIHLLCSTCVAHGERKVLLPYRGRNGWIYLECRYCNSLVRTGYQWIDNPDYFAGSREFGA